MQLAFEAVPFVANSDFSSILLLFGLMTVRCRYDGPGEGIYRYAEADRTFWRVIANLPEYADSFRPVLSWDPTGQEGVKQGFKL